MLINLLYNIDSFLNLGNSKNLINLSKDYLRKFGLCSDHFLPSDFTCEKRLKFKKKQQTIPIHWIEGLDDLDQEHDVPEQLADKEDHQMLEEINISQVGGDHF